jgi:hypothetical protein
LTREKAPATVLTVTARASMRRHVVSRLCFDSKGGFAGDLRPHRGEQAPSAFNESVRLAN